MLGRVRREGTKSQPRLKGDRQRPWQPVWGYDATSARFAPEPRPAARRWDARRATAPDQSQDLPQIDSALWGRARDSVHKSFPNPGRASVRASGVSAPAFRKPAELPKAGCRPKIDRKSVV